MRCSLFLCVIAVVSLSSCYGKDLIVGTSYNARLLWQKKIDYSFIPFKKRVKEVFYSDPSQQIIKGILARESEHTDGEPIITAGGVGFPFVNIRFKSERSSGLYYQIEVYG